MKELSRKKKDMRFGKQSPQSRRVDKLLPKITLEVIPMSELCSRPGVQLLHWGRSFKGKNKGYLVQRGFPAG